MLIPFNRISKPDSFFDSIPGSDLDKKQNNQINYDTVPNVWPLITWWGSIFI